MGFFSRLFGAKESSKPIDIANLPVRKAELDFSAILHLEDAPVSEDWDEEQDDPQDEIDVDYRAVLEYAVFDEELLKKGIENDELNTALNDLFYVCLTEFGSISINVIEGCRKEYEQQVLKKYNDALSEWGVKGLKLEFASIAPREQYREFYEQCKSAWE